MSRAQRFRMEHAPGAYVVLDTGGPQPKKVARFPYRTELTRGHAYTLARANMEERNREVEE